jgi:DNA-binding HxlR family transcriptional regulator
MFGPRTRAGDPDTSHQAEANVRPRMSHFRLIVLQHFAKHHLLTHLQLEDLCRDHGSTFRTRCNELVKLGYIVDSTRRVVQNGTPRVVWAITPKGMEAAKIFVL